VSRRSSERWPFAKPLRKLSALVDEEVASGRDHEKDSKQAGPHGEGFTEKVTTCT